MSSNAASSKLACVGLSATSIRCSPCAISLPMDAGLPNGPASSHISDNSADSEWLFNLWLQLPRGHQFPWLRSRLLPKPKQLPIPLQSPGDRLPTIPGGQSLSIALRAGQFIANLKIPKRWRAPPCSVNRVETGRSGEAPRPDPRHRSPGRRRAPLWGAGRAPGGSGRSPGSRGRARTRLGHLQLKCAA